MKNKLLPVVTLALLVTFVSSLAMAQSSQSDKAIDDKRPQAVKNLTEEERAAIREMHQAHRDKMEPLRDQLWIKNKEYQFLANNPNTELKDIQPVIREMAKLKGELRAAKEGFKEEMLAKGYDFGPRHKMFGGNKGGKHHGMGPDGYGHRGHGEGRGFGEGRGYGEHRGFGDRDCYNN